MGIRSKTVSFVCNYGLGTAGALAAIGVLLHDRLKNQNVVQTAKRDWNYQHKPSVSWDSNWDRRDPESLVKPDVKKDEDSSLNELKSKVPTATRHLLLLRHGQYNTDGIGDAERYLSKLGREQADLTGRRLKEMNLPYTKLISSTMTRAIETCDIIHKHFPDLKVERDDLLREGAPIVPEPLSTHWRPELKEFYTDGARIEAAFRKFFHRADVSQKEDSYEIYAIHANIVRYFVCRALQFQPEGWLRMSLAHASITHIVIRPSGRVHIRCLGETGHMPTEKVTFS